MSRSLQRFPRQKYIRQLHEVVEELAGWQAAYLEGAAQTTSDHLAGRFSGRAAVLADGVHQARQLLDTLYSMGRLS